MNNILKGNQIRIKFPLEFYIDQNLLKCILLSQNFDLNCKLDDENYIIINPIGIELQAGANLPYQIRLSEIKNPKFTGFSYPQVRIEIL